LKIFYSIGVLSLLVSSALANPPSAQSAPGFTLQGRGRALVFQDQGGSGAITAVAPDVLKITYLPTSVKPTATEVMADARARREFRAMGSIDGTTLRTDKIQATVQGAVLTVATGHGNTLGLDLSQLDGGSLQLTRSVNEHLYGMRGIRLGRRIDDSIFRDAGAHVEAASQGDGGAPLAFTATWGLLVDSVDGDFTASPAEVRFTHGSRKDVEVYLVIGPPKETLSVVARLTGLPPMPPKWTLGFMNSQWGLDEGELKSIVQGYRSRQIPLDGFILDFDYKAWGEDNYGEFRWNSTSNPGNVGPDKFPDGARGQLAKDLAALGVHLVGIMKPRVIVTTLQGGPTDAAKDGRAGNWFVEGQKPYPEYFSGRLANDVDFSTQGARDWFWSHAQGLYKAGMAGWWNDEADNGPNSLQFMNMQRSVYDGQRSISQDRVWSINRNFYLGAQRYAYGTWSGDIDSGFGSMRIQANRMIATLDLGQPHWSMDAGGFNGHPSPENYARWIEFASMVPIMRVHGTYGEKRQPWVYGQEAEAAATAAIRLRTQLIPTLYDLEHQASQTGIGMVRPMFWEFPDDPKCEGLTDQWMIGDSLLAAPIFSEGASSRSVYFPDGRWYPWGATNSLPGGAPHNTPPDENWGGLPLFVRGGSIIATQPVQQYVGEKPVRELRLDVYPALGGLASGEIYDDNGQTYRYARGDAETQQMRLTNVNGHYTLSFDAPAGRYRSDVLTYRVVVHAIPLAGAGLDGKALKIEDGSFVVPAWKKQAVSIDEALD